jgi:hypothetical protein
MTESDPAQRLQLSNETASILEIHVEPHPDRYLLQPNDKMVIQADLGDAPFTIHVHDGALQIDPGNDAGSPVTINGLPVEPDWETKI